MLTAVVCLALAAPIPPPRVTLQRPPPAHATIGALYFANFAPDGTYRGRQWGEGRWRHVGTWRVEGKELVVRWRRIVPDEEEADGGTDTYRWVKGGWVRHLFDVPIRQCPYPTDP